MNTWPAKDLDFFRNKISQLFLDHNAPFLSVFNSALEDKLGIELSNFEMTTLLYRPYVYFSDTREVKDLTNAELVAIAEIIEQFGDFSLTITAGFLPWVH